jgi:hypothetical protein
MWPSTRAPAGGPLAWRRGSLSTLNPATAKTLNPSHLKYDFIGYLKHVDAHIKETIILHNIFMYIEIEASVIFHRAWSNILHNGTFYTFMHIYNIISVMIFQTRNADGILRLVL